MLDAIQQAEDAAQTKAYEANQKYSAVTGEDNGTFKQIMNTIKS